VRAAPWPPPAPSRADLRAGVARLRAGDAAKPGDDTGAGANGQKGQAGPAPRLVPMDPAGSLAVLRDAVSSRRAVWISYLEDADRPAQARIQPLGVDAGRVRAVDLETGRQRHYAVHRVIGATPA
jgi:predicted DNA-binding transcriptional regulator YafY